MITNESHRHAEDQVPPLLDSLSGSRQLGAMRPSCARSAKKSGKVLATQAGFLMRTPGFEPGDRERHRDTMVVVGFDRYATWRDGAISSPSSNSDTLAPSRAVRSRAREYDRSRDGG